MFWSDTWVLTYWRNDPMFCFGTWGGQHAGGMTLYSGLLHGGKLTGGMTLCSGPVRGC
jgi:hypothetical protein